VSARILLVLFRRIYFSVGLADMKTLSSEERAGVRTVV
jgi:hypothetical protein